MELAVRAVGPWFQLALLAGCLLPVSVDVTVLYIAVPKLVADLSASDRQLLWIADIFPLTVAGLVLVTGPLGDRHGHARLLSIGLGVFGLASAAAAFSPTPGALIASRALLGVGAALIVPTTLALVRQLFADPGAQAIAIGIWGAVAAGGAAAGPLVGGLLLEHFWWGSVFLVNLPLVAVLLPLAGWSLPNRRGAAAALWSFRSPLLGMIGLVASLYALKSFAHPGEATALAPVALILGPCALLAFVRRELRSARPLLDLRLFADPRFRLGVLAATLPTGVAVGYELLLAQQLQLVLGLSPWDAALVLLPLPLAALVAGPLGGRLLAVWGGRRVVVLGLAVAAIGYLGIAWEAGSDAGAALRICLALLGLGHGVTMAAATATIMGAAPEERAGGAAAVESICFELGGGLGIALSGSLVALLYAGFLGPAAGPAAGHSLAEAATNAASLASEEREALLEQARAAYAAAARVAAALSGGLLLLAGVLFLSRR